MTQSGCAEEGIPDLGVVIPAYNEANRIADTLHRIHEYLSAQPYTWRVVVVDDGSSDSTADIARAILEPAGGLVLSYAPNRGKGHAVRYGMLRTEARYLLFSDADLATPIEEVERLWAAIKEGADIAIASRDVPGSHLVRRQSPLREMGGKLFNRCVQLLAVPGIRDTQCGFKLFTCDAAKRIFRLCTIDNFSFDVEVLYIARKLGYRIAEVPVTWRHQEGSKVRFLRDGLRMLKTLFVIRATRYDLGEPARSVAERP